MSRASAPFPKFVTHLGNIPKRASETDDVWETAKLMQQIGIKPSD
jgi:hypothetical protein